MKGWSFGILFFVGLCSSACPAPNRPMPLTIEVNRQKFEYRLVANAAGIELGQDAIEPWKMQCPHGAKIQLAFAGIPTPTDLRGYSPEVMVSEIYKPSQRIFTTQTSGPVTQWFSVRVLLPDLNDSDLAALRAFRILWYVDEDSAPTITSDWIPITSKDVANLSGSPP